MKGLAAAYSSVGAVELDRVYGCARMVLRITKYVSIY
jgi:hypothetical protein